MKTKKERIDSYLKSISQSEENSATILYITGGKKEEQPKSRVNGGNCVNSFECKNSTNNGSCTNSDGCVNSINRGACRSFDSSSSNSVGHEGCRKM